MCCSALSYPEAFPYDFVSEGAYGPELNSADLFTLVASPSCTALPVSLSLFAVQLYKECCFGQCWWALGEGRGERQQEDASDIFSLGNLIPNTFEKTLK